MLNESVDTVKKSKYKQGELINNLNELAEQDFIYFMGKVLNKGWFQNWQIHWAYEYIKRGSIFKADRMEGDI